MWEDELPPAGNNLTDMHEQGHFTFESFLVKDNCVVLWCLCQAEKLASGAREEVQMGRGGRREKEQRYSAEPNQMFGFFIITVTRNQTMGVLQIHSAIRSLRPLN